MAALFADRAGTVESSNANKIRDYQVRPRVVRGCLGDTGADGMGGTPVVVKFDAAGRVTWHAA